MSATTSIGRWRFQWAATARTSSSLTHGPCSRCGLEDEADSSSMSPLPIRRSAPGWSRITRLSASDDTEKAMRDGMLALITPVMTSTDGRWVASTRWMPDGPGHLGDPAHRLLDVAGRHHHQVVELVHHDQDERQAGRTRAPGSVVLVVTVVVEARSRRIRSR